MMLHVFAPVNWSNAISKKPQCRPMATYIVEHGDTLAGIALRHNIRESELRAMNNLFAGSVTFPGQKLKVFRKKRSQSLPALPFADQMNQESDDDYNARQQSHDSADEHKHLVPRKTANVEPEDEDDTHAAHLSKSHKHRSKSERLHTHYETDEFMLPSLIGGTSSEVLSDPQYCSKLVPKLETCLPTRFRGYDWKLQYSLAQHGSSLHALLHHVHNANPTLVVVETTRGEIFGGFVATPWKRSTSYYGIGESFVFTCYPHFERFPWSRKNSMIMLSTDKSIGMGGGGGFAWFLNADLSRGTSAQSDTFMNRRLTSESDFDIACVEVWSFVTKT
uniref:Oxidation resistance protein 1 n=1 Tax=Globisporangium ultimum (strain ATCC 200006 / CBS 805.95 / DAOM BR144) TaxID=431595 RepID=K3WKA9_GLOUD